MKSNYLFPLKEAFEKNANPENAIHMKAYMKGKFEYFGIKSPERKEIVKGFLKTYGLPEVNKISDIVKESWDYPQREFQYFAMNLSEKYVKKSDTEIISLFEFMIAYKQWWDTIDYIASNLVGELFIKFPEMIIPYTKKWMDSGDMWFQRTAILFQLKYKKNTDLDLLFDYISQLYGSKEFFINKAIGWILREYSKTDPETVKLFVANNADSLANLSKREALKWLERKKK
jgi:3-methyladenine DNA glycosylase AlkD